MGMTGSRRWRSRLGSACKRMSAAQRERHMRYLAILLLAASCGPNRTPLSEQDCNPCPQQTAFIENGMVWCPCVFLGKNIAYERQLPMTPACEEEKAGFAAICF